MPHHFHLDHTCPNSQARAGEIVTAHGRLPTPAFAPVGSQGSVKALTPDELKDIGITMVLANTYHLYLRPGIALIERLGGLHKFMGWDRVILTDSGGYQVFSLSPLRRVSDDGVVFRSHIDGSQHLFTPETTTRFQESLGADIIMALDECPPPQANLAEVKAATERTHRWAERCLKAQRRDDQALYAIVQGGAFPELRRQSAEYLASLDFPGYAIGGLSIGEPRPATLAMITETVSRLPEDKPRYLMGVGAPEDIMEAVARGIDLFDSALPTRLARNGSLFTRQGRLNIQNAACAQEDRAIEDGCDCYTCRTFSVAYLHHLFNRRELLAYRLATIHNLTFLSRLMRQIRGAILDGTFSSLKDGFLSGYRATNEQVRLDQKQKWLERRKQRQYPSEPAPDPPD